LTASVAELVAGATAAAGAGRWADAERLWLEVRKREPNNPKALFSLGAHALQRGDLKTARELLGAARAVAGRDLLTLLTLANVCRQQADTAAEREAIDAALAVDAYYIPALLAKGGWLERQRHAPAAAATYANALKISPPPSHWPDYLRPQLEHARVIVDRHSAELLKHVSERVAHLQAALPPDVALRWREAASIASGRTRAYHSESNQLHVPRLPAIPFFERESFPWAAALEANTAEIRAELNAALKQNSDRFGPYIAYNPGEPVNQWQELNHSKRWSAFHLYRAGTPVSENLARCPLTARCLEAVALADIPGLCPNAMFSALAPHTQIPPHNGETNARVVVHLPLIVPNNCSYRVGFDWREWRVGEILAFDDTLEHEARNDSDELRVVLIFDVWNPLLLPAEREMVRALVSAVRTFG
jgi:aspartate beta-hydroxylase